MKYKTADKPMAKVQNFVLSEVLTRKLFIFKYFSRKINLNSKNSKLRELPDRNK